MPKQPKEFNLSPDDQIALLHSMAGNDVVALAVDVSTRRRPRHRKYFSSDEAHTEHCRQFALVKGACGQVVLTYQTPIPQWTGADLDRLIHDVINVLDSLPHLP